MSNNWSYILNDNNLLKESHIILKILRNNLKIILNTKLNDEENCKKILKLIIKNYNDFNSFYSIVQLSGCINKSLCISSSKNLLRKYDDNLKKSTRFYALLKNIYNYKHLKTEEKIFIENLINVYIKNHISLSDDHKINLISNYINKLNNELYNDINNYSILFDIESKFITHNTLSKQNVSPNTQNLTFKINFNNYDYINSIITNADKRNDLQNTFFSMSNTIMKNFTKILILKHQFAKKNSYNHYGSYILNKDNEEFSFVENILKHNINNMSSILLDLFKYISNDMNIKKISEADIRYWFYNKKNKMFFSVNELLELLKLIIKKYFGLNFIEKKNTDIWHESVKTLYVYNERNDLIGYLFLDLLFRNKKIKCPNVIILNDYYQEEQNIKLPCIALLAGYQSVEEKNLTINDSLYFFKQFGFIIHHLSHKSKFGLHNINFEFYNFMPYLMENIFWDSKTLEYLCNDSDLINDVVNIYKMEKIYELFFSSVNGLFDLLIHTSEHFVDICKELAKDENNLHVHMNKLYFNLYDTLMEKYKDHYNYNKNSVNPSLIHKIINGDACVLYNNILNNIISFNLFKYITIHNKGIEFRKLVMEKSNDYFKNLLNKFSEQYSFNIFDSESFMQNFKNLDSVMDQDKQNYRIKVNTRIIKEKINKITL